MAESQPGSSGGQDRTDLAEDRTGFAEDRTLLANERPFAGWMRTGLAAVGIGLGFHALFGTLSPLWVAKAIATGFILVGVLIFVLAARRGCSILDRLTIHNVEPVSAINLKLIAGTMATGALTLVVALWTLA